MIIFILPKKGENDDFSIDELLSESIIYHDDCNGGKIILEFDYQYDGGDRCYNVSCKRCSYSSSLLLNDSERSEICKTAIDGEERKSGSKFTARQEDAI